MKNDDCHIPLLESVFVAFPDIPINVDIKTNCDVLIDKVSWNDAPPILKLASCNSYL